MAVIALPCQPRIGRRAKKYGLTARFLFPLRGKQGISFILARESAETGELAGNNALRWAVKEGPNIGWKR